MAGDLRVWRRIRHQIEAAGAFKLEVGVVAPKASEQHGGGDATNAEIALFMEFGTRTVPERSFIRRTLRDNGVLAEYRRVQTETMKAVFMGVMSPRRALEIQGEFLAEAMKRTVTEHEIPPPLKPATVAAKRAHGAPEPEHPLVDHRELVESIGYRIVG